MNTFSYKTILLLVLAIAVFALALVIYFERRRRVGTKRTKYVDALHALMDGKKDDALRLLAQAVKNGETDIDAYILLGSLLREKGSAEKAFQLHRGLTVRRDLRPGEDKAIKLEIAEDLIALGKKDRATGILSPLAEKSADSETLLRLHGLFHRCGEYEKAFNVLKSLSKSGGKITSGMKAAYLASIASSFVEIKDDSSALKYISRALKEDRTCTSALYLAGRIHMSQGDNAKAAEVWQKLIETDTRFFSDVMPMLEKVLYESGQFDRLIGILGSLYESNSDDYAVGIALASLYGKMGQGERCITILEEQRKYLGDHSDLVLKLAEAYLQSGRTDKAKAVLEEYDPSEEEKPGWVCDNCGASYEYPLQYCLKCSGIGTIHR